MSLSRHSLLAAVLCSTSIISFNLGSSASLSSPFSSPCYVAWFQLFSLSVLLVLSLERQWLHEPTWGRMYIYGITYVPYIHTYIHIENPPANSLVWARCARPNNRGLVRSENGARILGGCSALWGEREGVVWCIIVFHSTPFTHLHTSYITIASFPGLPHLRL